MHFIFNLLMDVQFLVCLFAFLYTEGFCAVRDKSFRTHIREEMRAVLFL